MRAHKQCSIVAVRQPASSQYTRMPYAGGHKYFPLGLFIQLLGTEYCSDDTHDERCVRARTHARAPRIIQGLSGYYVGERANVCECVCVVVMCAHRELNANCLVLWRFLTSLAPKHSQHNKDAFNFSLKIPTHADRLAAVNPYSSASSLSRSALDNNDDDVGRLPIFLCVCVRLCGALKMIALCFVRVWG